MWRLLLAELLVVVVIAAVWFVGPLLGLTSIGGRLLVIGALLGPPAALLIWKLIQKRKEAKGLENALSQQRKSQAGLTPDRQAEIDKLAGQFDEAVGALKASRLAGGGSALYALPWYVIIGPPGAGKSTALVRSGLKFPFSTGKDPAIRGVGGTRNCDWWFSEQAILLDTAGRYALQEEDKEEWLGFLRLLKKYRSKRPLNGVLVCVSIAELADAAAADIDDTADRIRKRVDEVVSELELVPPIYLLFSKCDLLNGFVETFGHLKPSARGQIFGFTLPLAEKRSVEDAFDAEFAALLDDLGRRSLATIGRAKEEDRPGIYQFPLQFSATREKLKQFSSRLFQQNPYKEVPQLRGVYFCSGTQEGRPIDRVMAQLGRTLGLKSMAAALETRTDTKSYFLRDLFTEVIIPDQRLAVSSAAGRRRRFRLQVAGIGAALLAATTVVGFGVTSYGNNRSLVHEALEEAEQARLTDEEEAAQLLSSLNGLQQVAERLQQLEGYQQEGPPLSYSLGYYQGDKLVKPLQRLFNHRMKRVFVTPVGTELEALLSDMVHGSESGGGDSTQTVARDYALLRTYVMLTDRKHLQVDEAKSVLLEQWKRRLNPDVARKSELLKGLIKAYLVQVKAGRARWLSRDNELLEGARQALRGRDVEYRAMVSTAAGDLPASTLRDLLRGRIQNVLKASKSVPAVYTRAGWTLHVRRSLEEGSQFEAWVLGEPESPAELSQRFQQRYFDEYVRNWRGFLRGLSLERPATVQDALRLLEGLTEQPPLYQTLLSAVAYQTAFPLEADAGNAMLGGLKKRAGKHLGKKLAKKAKVKVGPGEEGDEGSAQPEPSGPVADAFRAVRRFVNPPPGPDGKPQIAGLQQYLDQLTVVRDELAKFIEAGEAADPAALNGALADARRMTKAVLKPLPGGLRSVLSQLLYTPLLSAADQAKQTQGSLMGSSFAGQVCEAFKEKLAGRYPFAKARRDALQQDAVDFFAPGGTVWGYFDSSLKGKLQRKSNAFVPIGEQSVPANIISFYTKAWAVTRALFPRGGEEPKIAFEVRPAPPLVKNDRYAVSEVTLEVGEQKYVYRNGPRETWTYRWPDGQNARIIIRGANGLREEIAAEGDWALMRLIDRGSTRKSGSWYKVEWRFKRGAVRARFDVRPSRSENPLFDDLRLSCES